MRLTKLTAIVEKQSSSSVGGLEIASNSSRRTERTIYIDHNKVTLIEDLSSKECLIIVDRVGYKVKGSALEVADKLKIVLK